MFDNWFARDLFRDLNRLRLSAREVYRTGGASEFLKWREDHERYGLPCPDVPQDIAARFHCEYRSAWAGLVNPE